MQKKLWKGVKKIIENEMIKSKKELKEYYNRKRVVEEYDLKRFHNTYGNIQHEIEMGIINSTISKYKNPRLLEIAVGTGRVTKNIKGSGIGIDSSENMLEIARKNAPNWKFVKMDAKNLNFRQKFDIVISLRLIRHFNRRDRKEVYKKIHHLLSGKGILIFDMPTGRQDKILRFIDKFKRHDRIYEADTPINKISKELSESGFDIIRLCNTKYDNFIFRMLCIINDKLNIFYPWLKEYIEKLITRLDLAANIIIIAEKSSK